MLLSFDSLRERVTLLHGCGGGEGVGGYFIRNVEVIGDGSLFFQVCSLLLFLHRFQVSGRAGNFSLGCIRYQII